MDRTPYQLPFTANRIPLWMCPVCRVGHLTLPEDALLEKESAASANEPRDEDWEPTYVRGVFACMFKCSNPKCGDWVTCVGRSRVEVVEYEGEDGWDQAMENLFYPEFFSPPLVLIDIPKGCPESVRTHLKESFALFFADSGAALNCVRSSVEALLTDIGVGRKTKTKKNTFRTLSLHERIGRIPAQYRALSDMFLAIKWLGNAGSHGGDTPNSEDVRNAYELIEHVLSEVYDLRSKKLGAITKKINKKKGPEKKA